LLRDSYGSIYTSLATKRITAPQIVEMGQKERLIMALYPNVIRETADFGGQPITLETGRLAKQTAASILVTQGETVVLVTVTSTYAPRPGMNFFPLVCDYVEKTYAAGKLPGGFFKREGRHSERATLTCRLIDRPIRPLFPDGFMDEVQVVATVLSVDPAADPRICAMIGTSAALSISDIPWKGPIAATTVGRIDGKWVVGLPANCTDTDMDLLIAARRDGIVMVEGEAKEISEAETVEALRFGHDAMIPVFDAIDRLTERAGKEKRPFELPAPNTALIAKVRDIAAPLVKEAAYIPEKLARYAAMAKISKTVMAQLGDEADGSKGLVKEEVSNLKSEIVRGNILNEGRRIDGRGLADVREIQCEVGILPRTHGSALFTRGETQALVTITFGTKRDEQRIDALEGEYKRRFLLHYNFPAFSVGEVRMLRGPGRREIGHGNLALRGLMPIIPDVEEFPYTIRSVSEILESNGSSSMATVCGTSLALMQAGVPVKKAVAGIAMGLIEEEGKYAVLSDILGDEDHLGDMDFKVVGSADGITALQMDIKIDSLSWDVLGKALDQAREGRQHILGEMAKTIGVPNDDLAEYAPRIFTVLINPDKIRDLIGPGGKHIRGIVDATGVDIDVTDDGKVSVAAVDGESAVKAIELIRGYTEEPEVGKTYLGKVAKTVDFGAFITIMPGTDGLCHISELADGRVRTVEDVVRVDDEVLVKVIGIDQRGKIKLSRRAALEEQADAAPVDEV
jgi:polyribonucleotide nucleotidyltransferase